MKIDSDIPLKARIKYPYVELDVGQSFLIPADVSLQAVCNMNYRYGKRHGRRYVARKQDDGTRVWREK
jgi:hypothetical protein